MATPAPPSTAGHRRNKSASVIKSFMSSKSHKRMPSDGTALHLPYMPHHHQAPPLLPPDHPHSLRPPADAPANPPSPRKSYDVRPSPRKGMHSNTASSISLRSLARDKDKPKEQPLLDLRLPHDQEPPIDKTKRIKSSTNLASMFGKSKSKDTRQSSPVKDKENTAPRTSIAVSPIEPRTPIWAQFSSQPLQDVTTTSRAPLSDQRRGLDDETTSYSPQDYSPAKQRNFENSQPSLQKRPVAKERPKSMHVPKSTSTASLLNTFSRKKSSDRAPLSDTHGNEGRQRDSSPSKGPPLARPLLNRASTDISRISQSSQPAAPPPASPKKQNRVMAAVAAFNGKAKQTDSEPAPASPTKLDPAVVDAEFEEVLESRNIPTHQRAQMRTLKLEVKADFVRTHKLDLSQTSKTGSINSSIGDGDNKQSKKSSARSTRSRNGSIKGERESLHPDKSESPTKRERPRSKTFTFSRNDSPTKKSRGGETAASRMAQIPKSPSTRSLVSVHSERSVSSGSKTVKSSEFITYLRKTPKPQDVEVGKLHKLRLLLRNETVDWVDTFIEDGGMLELVGLLHRIMEIEWREDHEDTLLHELLRCLKGLCTTDSALRQLVEISPTLYPALLAMLFDEEHKGPSEFTTRELIIQIVFTHIAMAPEAELHTRATELLAYLKDPAKEKDSSTVPFILQMHRPRPYQVWCKEMTNVTKEVFWIFIHHLNVVPIPPEPAKQNPPLSYAKKHFPGPRAIVPAAPYVGGVEWDATNYVATHIDLVNGLLASLSTREARNTLRHEFKISGFEKLMGHIRACNPKYYGAVHDSVKVWIGAALEDDWDVKEVRMGASDGKNTVAPLKQSPKKKVEAAPQIQVPKIDLGLGMGLGFDKEIDVGYANKKDDDWI